LNSKVYLASVARSFCEWNNLVKQLNNAQYHRPDNRWVPNDLVWGLVKQDFLRFLKTWGVGEIIAFIEK